MPIQFRFNPVEAPVHIGFQLIKPFAQVLEPFAHSRMLDLQQGS